jgi:hypothetical protein
MQISFLIADATDLWLQVIIYNHGVLSLMDTNSLVIVADLDEYLSTYEPLSIHQVRLI